MAIALPRPESPSSWRRAGRALVSLAAIVALLILLLAAVVVAAAIIALTGLRFIEYLVLVIAIGAAIVRPRPFALGLGAAIIAIDPSAALNDGDFLGPFANFLYFGPAELVEALPITISPVEILMLITLGSVLLRPADRPIGSTRLPALIWVAGIAIAVGMVLGLARGGPYNLVYHEARGLLYGGVALVIALRLRGTNGERLARTVLLATAVAAALSIARYLTYFRTGDASVAFEFQYAHEGVIFFGYGMALAAVSFLRARTLPAHLLYASHGVLMVAAAMVTGRRAAILVVGICGITLLWMLIPKRTAPAVLLTALLSVVMVGYLASYWNQSYGALAQPARAVRSQFEPNPRDAASDAYRDAEAYNMIQTLRADPFLGVSFGRPYDLYAALPDQTSFWPLQFHTGENNLVWLWLKTGFFGITAIVGIWAIALSRSMAAYRAVPSSAPLPVLPIVLIACLVLHLAFAQVDQGFSTTRSAVPLAVVLAVALGRSLVPSRAREEPATAPQSERR